MGGYLACIVRSAVQAVTAAQKALGNSTTAKIYIENCCIPASDSQPNPRVRKAAYHYVFLQLSRFVYDFFPDRLVFLTKFLQSIQRNGFHSRYFLLCEASYCRQLLLKNNEKEVKA